MSERQTIPVRSPIQVRAKKTIDSFIEHVDLPAEIRDNSIELAEEHHEMALRVWGEHCVLHGSPSQAALDYLIRTRVLLERMRARAEMLIELNARFVDAEIRVAVCHDILHVSFEFSSR